jgi:hypothetical protein
MFKLGNRRLWRTAPILGFLVLSVFSHPAARTNKQTAPVLSQLGSLMVLSGADAVTIDRNPLKV